MQFLLMYGGNVRSVSFFGQWYSTRFYDLFAACRSFFLPGVARQLQFVIPGAATERNIALPSQAGSSHV
jgi:hypothetical protein